MAFTRGRGSSGAGSGTELASGFISLSVKYNSAMSQIAKDFGGLEAAAATSGSKAGAALGNSFTRQANIDVSKGSRYALDTAGIDMERKANQIGATVGAAFGRAIGAPLGAIAGAFRKVGDDGGKALREGLTSHIEELTSSNIGLKQSVLDAGQAYQTLKSNASIPLSDLNFAHQRLISAQNEAKQGVIDLAMAHQQLRSATPAVEEVSKSFGGLKNSVTEASSAVGLLGLDAEAVTGKATGIGTALIALATNPLTAVAAVAAGVVGITTALYDMGEKWESTFKQVEVRTGFTGAKLAELQSSIEKVVGTVPQGIASVGDVAAYVATRFKDTGSGIADVTHQIELMQSMFGTIDLDKLGRAFSAFSMGNDPKAQIALLGQLAAASQATQTPINDLVSVVAKAPGALREFGLSMAESVSLISEFDKAGINPQGVLFSLSRAAGLAGKSGKDLNTALTNDLNETKRILETEGKDAAERFAVGWAGPTSARGGGGIMVTALMAGFDPNVIKDFAAQSGVNLQELYDKAKMLPQVWGELKGQIAKALEPVAVPVFKEIEGFFTRIAGWVEAHKDELPQMFVNAAIGVERFAAHTLTALASIGHALGDVLHAMGTAFGSDSLKQAGDAINQASSGMDTLSNGITKPGGVVDATKAFGENLKVVAELTKALGPATATLGANIDSGLDIKGATADTIKNLKDMKVHFEQVGADPTHLKLLPDTPEAIRLIDAMRREQGKVPLNVPIQPLSGVPSLRSALGEMSDYVKAHPLTVKVGIASASGTAGTGSTSVGSSLNDYVGGLGKNFMNDATGIGGPPVKGGNPLTWLWTGLPSNANGSITSFARGGSHLPSSAKIQSPVGRGGLVQWAEPSTGGEAFIPLHPAKRARSTAIWKQTGKILLGGNAFRSTPKSSMGAYFKGLGAKTFADGGISGADPRKTQSGVLQVIYDDPGTGVKTGEAGGKLVGPGTDQPGYYAADWGGHTGHVHTSFASGLNGEFYGLPKGSNIRQGAGGFPSWVYDLGKKFGVEPSTYAGHQESSGFNRGIDWWPAKHADMSGASYTPAERGKLQSFASYVSGVASHGTWGQGAGPAGTPTPGAASTSGTTDSKSAVAPAGSGFRVFGSDFYRSFDRGGIRGVGGDPGFRGDGPTSPSDPVAAIVAEGRKRGYSETDIAWIVADSKGESGWNTQIANGDHIGLFQQDSGYPGRGTMAGQITGFFDRLDKTSSSMSIGDRISKTPAEGGVEGGGYGPDWIAQYLPAAKTAVAGVMPGVGGTSALGDQTTSLTPAQSAANDQAIAAGDAKLKKLQGDLDVANLQLQEAQDKPVGSGPKAPEAHDDAVNTAQARVEKIKGDLGAAQTDRDNMDNLAGGDPKALVAAQNRVTDAVQRQTDAQTKLNDAQADPTTKPSVLKRDQDAYALATDNVAKAKAHQGDVETKLQTPGKGGKGGAGSGSASGGLDFGKLADIGTNAIAQSFLPPGFINPFATDAMRIPSVIMGFLGGLGNKYGGALGGETGKMLDMGGALLSGKGSNIAASIQAFVPQVDPNQGQAGSPNPDQSGNLPGLNTVFPQGSPASGGGTGTLPGPANAQGQYGNQLNIHNDFSGAQIGPDANVQGVLQDQNLANARHHAMSPNRDIMPGAH